MEAAIDGLVLVFDKPFVIQDLLYEILGRKVDIFVFVDSQRLFDVVAKDGSTTEKRLLIGTGDLR